MRLTPLDIKKQDFKRTMRGLDPDEVQGFLQMLANQWQELLEDNSRLDRRILELESKLDHYKQVEEAMQEALKTARQSSRQTLEAAKAKSTAIVEEAVSAATRIQKKAEDEKYGLRREIERLRSRRAEVIARLRALLNSELAILEDHEQQYPTVADNEVEDLESTVQASGAIEVDTDSAQQDVVAMESLEASAEIDEEDLGSVTNDFDDVLNEVNAVERAHEDTLRFDPRGKDKVDHTPPPKDHTPPPKDHTPPPKIGPAAPRKDDQREVRHSSPEMDKIRKILDDLA